MIKANELRVGNVVLKHRFFLGERWTWGRISHEDIYSIACGNDKDYKPIPLTEEWLLKLGFSSNKHGYVFNMFRIKKYVTGFFYGYIPIFLDDIDEDIDDVEIKYVHQLQNLYFALTGEELKLKDNELTEE